MLGTVGHTINVETKTKNIGILPHMHTIFHPSVYNIGDLRCRLHYFYWRVLEGK